MKDGWTFSCPFSLSAVTVLPPLRLICGNQEQQPYETLDKTHHFSAAADNGPPDYSTGIKGSEDNKRIQDDKIAFPMTVIRRFF